MEIINPLTNEPVQVQEWQLNLKPGDYYLIASPICQVGHLRIPAPPIYGYVEDIEHPYTGYIYVRGFSQWCPAGELGGMFIAEPTRQLTAAEFLAAQSADWPTSPPEADPSLSLEGEGRGEGESLPMCNPLT